MVMNISCKFEKSTYYTLASRRVTRKSLHTAVAAAYFCIMVNKLIKDQYPSLFDFRKTTGDNL